MDAAYVAALALGSGAVVDVGVNRMQILVKILSLDPNRRYVGFEPQLEAALAARDFAKRNGLDEVEIVCAGLADTSGLTVLRLRPENGFDGAASINDGRPDGFYCGRMAIPIVEGDAALVTLDVGKVGFHTDFQMCPALSR